MKSLIFGAGASIPFFEPQLTTQYLTDAISDKLKWQSIITKYSSTTESDLIPSSEEVIKTIEIIKEINPEYNFEQIAEIIDKIASLSFDDMPKNNMLNAFIVTLLRSGKFVNNEKFQNWVHIPFLLRMIIAEAIMNLEQNNKALNYDELMKTQHEFLKFYTESETVSIFSFNYDDILLNSVKNIGFQHGFNKLDKRGRRLDIHELINAKKAICFPHGHLRFNFLDDENVECYSDAKVAHEARWENNLSMYSPLIVTPGKFAYNFNTFITTGQTKDDSFNLMPYSFYYQKLATDLLTSKEIVVVGYSFGDVHLNRLLISFLKINSKNRVLIIDYYADDVSLTDEYRDSDNIVFKISVCFKSVWNLIYKADAKLTDRPVDVEQINKQGFGVLFPQIVFYKKGYEEFLNEYKAVIQLFKTEK